MLDQVRDLFFAAHFILTLMIDARVDRVNHSRDVTLSAESFPTYWQTATLVKRYAPTYRRLVVPAHRAQLEIALCVATAVHCQLCVAEIRDRVSLELIQNSAKYFDHFKKFNQESTLKQPQFDKRVGEVLKRMNADLVWNHPKDPEFIYTFLQAFATAFEFSVRLFHSNGYHDFWITASGQQTGRVIILSQDFYKKNFMVSAWLPKGLCSSIGIGGWWLLFYLVAVLFGCCFISSIVINNCCL
jgi:hypothetical protein